MIETTRTRIHVLTKGPAGRCCCCMVTPEMHLTWHKVVPRLAEQFSVVVPDLRSYGASGKPEGGERHENYSFRAMATDQGSTPHPPCVGVPDPVSWTMSPGRHAPCANGFAALFDSTKAGRFDLTFCESLHL